MNYTRAAFSRAPEDSHMVCGSNPVIVPRGDSKMASMHCPALHYTTHLCKEEHRVVKNKDR